MSRHKIRNKSLKISKVKDMDLLSTFCEQHFDMQIKEAYETFRQSRNQRSRQFRLCLLVEKFSKAETTKARIDILNHHLKFIQRSNVEYIIDEPNQLILKILHDSRNVHKDEWKGVLLEYSETLCRRALVPKLVSSSYFEIRNKSHLTIFINLLRVAHHYGYDIEA